MGFLLDPPLPVALGTRRAAFFRHLLDADPASDTLGWRWVAGRQTRGKTYLVTAQNIGKFCSPELLERAGGTGLDDRVVARAGLDDDPTVDDVKVFPEIPTEAEVPDLRRRLG